MWGVQSSAMDGYIGAVVSKIDFDTCLRRKNPKTSVILHFSKCKILEGSGPFLLN